MFAHSELGWAMIFSGRDREALQHFEEAIRLSPRDPSLFLGYFGIGYVRFEMRAFDQAIAPLRQAITLAPNFSWPHILTGTLVMMERTDEARIALAAYFRSNPVAKTIADLRANPVSTRIADGPLYGALQSAGMELR